MEGTYEEPVGLSFQELVDDGRLVDLEAVS